MENKNLQLIDLTVEEMVYLSSFNKTIKQYGIDGSIYHYGTYGEHKICINKNDKNIWEVYIGEMGTIFNKVTSDSCFDACIVLLKYTANTKEEENELINHYKKVVVDMKNGLKEINEYEIIPEVSNALLELKK